MQSTTNGELTGAIAEKSASGRAAENIERFRPRILDLTLRNQLLNTRFKDSTHTHIRLVDEIPQVIIDKMISGKNAKLAALPNLDDTPPDEKTPEFKTAVTELMSSDSGYLEAIQKIEQDATLKDGERESKEEESLRNLKDKAREQLGLPPRQKEGKTVDLVKHAAMHGIDASYDLPSIPEDGEIDERHSDNEFQTLLLTDRLSLRSERIKSRAQSYESESGVRVLQCAVGFLEWQDDASDRVSLSPIVLIPVVISSMDTKDGKVYYAGSEDPVPVGNAVLLHKFRSNYGLDLPMPQIKGEDEGDAQIDIEAYYQEIEGLKPKRFRKWNIKRQAAIGLWQVQTLAMYEDLDPSKWPNANGGLMGRLLGTKENGSELASFMGEHDVESEEAEAVMPMQVGDLDSSQASAIVDIMLDKDLALEGPPGAGKSQTIVNAICAALAGGKKVLFVAEKAAALNVVKARLQAMGMGPFLLDLQLANNSRTKVIESIRERLELKRPNSAFLPMLEEMIDDYRETRAALNDYVSIMKTPYYQSGMTHHDVMGLVIKSHETLEAIPGNLDHYDIPNVKSWTEHTISQSLDTMKSLGDRLLKIQALDSHWGFVACGPVNPFTISAITTAAREANDTLGLFIVARNAVTEWGLPVTELEALVQFRHWALDNRSRLLSANAQLVAALAGEDARETMRELKGWLANYANSCEILSGVSVDNGLVDEIKAGENYLARMNFTELSQTAIDDYRNYLDSGTKKMETMAQEIDKLCGLEPTLATLPVSDVLGALAVLKSLDDDLIHELPNRTFEHRERKDAEQVVRLMNAYHTNRLVVGEIFDLNLTIDSSTVSSALSELRSKGALAFLSSGYRKAKKSFRGILKNPQDYSDERMLEAAPLLLQYLSEKDEIQKVSYRYDDYDWYRGENTDVRLLASTLKFQADIEAAVPNEESALTMLHLSPSSKISLLKFNSIIASVPDSAQDWELARIKTMVDSMTATREQDASELEALRQLLAKLTGAAKSWGFQDLDQLVQDIETHTSLTSKILSSPSREALGSAFTGTETAIDVADLEIALNEELDGYPSECRQVVIDILSKDQSAFSVMLESIDGLKQASQTHAQKLTGIESQVKAKVDLWGFDPWSDDASNRFQSMSNDSIGLDEYARYNHLKREMTDLGLMPLVEMAERLRLDGEGLSNVMRAILGYSMSKEIYSRLSGRLDAFRGSELNELRERLQKLDKEILELNRQRLALKLYQEEDAPGGWGGKRVADYTDMTLLNHESKKKKRHIATRSLTARAGDALLEIKPCWMMSPQAVSMYLPKESDIFDLLIIDEGSQMRPENALGAILRSKNVMVVGDTKQLPPTNNFQAQFEPDESEDEREDTLDQESILDLANLAIPNRRRLRWHYRSKHESLIAFCNRHIYSDNLIIFPTADQDNPLLGVKLVEVEDATYRASLNQGEAEVMVDHIIRHMTDHPNQSLGVVVLNQKQATLLEDMCKDRISSTPAASAYVQDWAERDNGLEPFFVKSLESVQGDERDCIFIGTVFGSDGSGKEVANNFGPINSVHGHRRLNVLFSRAKEQIVTFTSMKPSDIRSRDEDGVTGKWMLRKWLEYSKTGHLDAGIATGKEADSDFELHVISVIESLGYVAVPQVGVQGYFIDIGVRHPDYPYGFLMGVECDGATYHSAKAARDRDRLREEVLKTKGWDLHRIWSTDWFTDPRHERDKMKQRLDDQLAAKLAALSVETETTA